MDQSERAYEVSRRVSVKYPFLTVETSVEQYGVQRRHGWRFKVTYGERFTVMIAGPGRIDVDDAEKKLIKYIIDSNIHIELPVKVKSTVRIVRFRKE